MTVTYSVCIGGAGIDYSSVTSILYTYSAFSSSCGFTPVGWGYAGPALGLGLPRCQLRVSDIAVTDSARFCGGGFDSFLGFEYVVLITLALRVTRVRVLLSFSPTSLRSLRILASLGVT